MSDTHAQTVSYVRETMLPEAEPPVGNRGALLWVRENLFSGWLNITDFTDSLDLGEDEDLCEIIDNLDSQCEPCPHDESQSCISLVGDRLTALAVDIDLEQIEERNSHPDCELSEADE